MGSNVRRIILLGPPGAGKGTQAEMICNKLSIPHISTGVILRAAVSSGTDLGQRVKEVLDRGDLVSDELVNEVVRERLGQSDCKGGYLLDGYPRTLPQAESLAVICGDLDQPITHVVEIEVPEKVLLERIEGRREEGQGRSDDTIEVARNRFQVYHEQTAPLSEYYASSGILNKVDGVGSVEVVLDRVMQALD